MSAGAGDHPLEPEARGLEQPALGAHRGAEPPGEGDLAGHDGRRTHGSLAEARRERHRDREVGRRLVDPQAAGDVHVHVVARQVQPGVAGEDGDEHQHAVHVDPGRRPSRRPVAGRRAQRLDLDRQRARALQRDRDRGAGARVPRPTRGRSGSGPPPRRGRRRASRARRPRRSIRIGSSPRAAAASRRGAHPRGRSPRRRGARASAARRRSPPS